MDLALRWLWSEQVAHPFGAGRYLPPNLMTIPMKTVLSSRRKVGLAVAGLLAGALPLMANDRDDRAEDAFKNSHVYKTQLRSTDVAVNVTNGVAVLSGSVENEDQKHLAEDTMRGLPGVDRVDNHIRVTNEPKEASDDWIALKVRSALLFHRNVSATDTHVVVRDGVVTLTGTASSDAEKALASEYANDIKGVRSVDNQLRVVDPEVARAERRAAADTDRAADADRIKRQGNRINGNETDPRTAGSRIDDASITAQVKASLAVRKSTSALRTNVTTRDGIVTLTGEAKNGAEKDLVTKLAENVDGVRSVRNDMTVQDR